MINYYQVWNSDKTFPKLNELSSGDPTWTAYVLVKYFLST